MAYQAMIAWKLYRRVGSLIAPCFQLRDHIIISIAYGMMLLTTIAQGQSLSTNSIRADITTHAGDHARFIEGSGVSFLVSLSQRAYVLLVLENGSNLRTQLYPAQSMPNVRQDMGDYLPLTNFSTTLRVSPPFGRETVTMLVSDRPLPPLPIASNGAFSTLSWSNEQWRTWLQAYPNQCGCQFVIDQVSFTTFADDGKL